MKNACTPTDEGRRGASHAMTERIEQRWALNGARIREARTRVGLTQAGLARTLGVSAHAVWSWERGRMKPNHEHLVALASHCEVSTDWLLGRDAVLAELLEETDVSFRDMVAGLPAEEVDSILEFIRFVRERRRRREAAG